MAPLSVNLTPVANLNHKDAKSAVLNVTNYPAIAHPVAPESSVRPDQCLARVAWVFQSGDALIQKSTIRRAICLSSLRS